MSAFFNSGYLVAVFTAGLPFLCGCSSEPASSPKESGGAAAIPGAYSGAFSAWDSLEPRLMPAWSVSTFWQENQEECAYYEMRIEDGVKKQFESKTFLKRTTLPSTPGVPAEAAWFFRCEPGDSLWPLQEGWFSVQPFPQPRSWKRSYEGKGTEQFGDPQKGTSYAIRQWMPADANKAISSVPSAKQQEENLGEGILLADQLPFLLRNLAFTPGKQLTCTVYPLPRRGLASLSKPLQFELRVDNPETVTFQGEEFPCWLVTLNAGETVIEKFWFNRNYPNVMVRWENMIGESKTLKYVRYAPTF